MLKAISSFAFAGPPPFLLFPGAQAAASGSFALDVPRLYQSNCAEGDTEISMESAFESAVALAAARAQVDAVLPALVVRERALSDDVAKRLRALGYLR